MTRFSFLVFGRVQDQTTSNEDRLVAFCEKLSKKTGVTVQPAESAEAAVHGSHVVNVIAGKAPGRTSARQITLYESHGMGLQDLWVGAKMLKLARERRVGTALPVGL